jgi:hypothetical protein
VKQRERETRQNQSVAGRPVAAARGDTTQYDAMQALSICDFRLQATNI